MVAMAGKTGGSPAKEIAKFPGKTWAFSDVAGRPTLNSVYAYAMVNALVGVVEAAALENSPLLKEPDLEEALCQIDRHAYRRRRRQSLHCIPKVGSCNETSIADDGFGGRYRNMPLPLS